MVKLKWRRKYMKMAYHKKTSKNYTQYNCRILDEILDKIRTISVKEDISINEVINQSLQFAIDNYEEKEEVS